MATDIAIDPRAALLAELGVTAEVQGRLDRIAATLRTASAELAEASAQCEPGSDTENRIEEALQCLDEVLDHLEWKAPEGEGESPS